MYRAAVPKYLPRRDFSEASPALRFNMLLSIWKDDWKKSDGKDKEFHSIKVHPEWSRNFQKRQKNLSSLDNTAMFQAKSISPFVTGMGMEHPLENGFAFLNPYGCPYLPGSGVKGVVRRAAEELAHENFFGTKSKWTLPAVWRLFGFEPWLANAGGNKDEMEDFVSGFKVSRGAIVKYLNKVLPERSSAFVEKISSSDNPLNCLLEDRALHTRGALSFWDVVPEISGGQLTCEIMTPHQSHYLQGEESPHDSGQPNPIPFLTVPPGSDFTFHVACDDRRLGALSDSWRELLESAFEHAFKWLGFGAKTAVGYGAMSRDRKAEDNAREDKKRRIEEKREKDRLASLPKVEREIQEAVENRPDKAEPESTFIIRLVEQGKWENQEKIEAANWLRSQLDKEKQSGLSKKQTQKYKAKQEKVDSWLRGE